MNYYEEESEEDFVNRMKDYYTDEEPVCKVGDVCYVCTKDGIVKKVAIKSVEKMKFGHYVYRANGRSYFNRNFGDCIFKSFTECKRVNMRRFAIKEKRKLLKEYELELNKKLGIEDNYIIR